MEYDIPLNDEQEAQRKRRQNGVNVNLICGISIEPEPIRWLWDGWLAAGKIHVLAGPPGTGKTTIATALAAALTCGGSWPDGTQAGIANVLVWSGEDDPADTLVPRFKACGADMGRVYFVGDVFDGSEARVFDPSIDAVKLAIAAEKIGGIKLLIIDPIVSAVQGDSHKNTEVRRGLQPLVEIASAMDCAVLGISHFSKGTAGRDPVDRVTGSIAFGAVARLVFAAVKMRDDDQEGGSRLFCRAKSNIGKDDGGFRYDLHQVELDSHPGVFASKLVWGSIEQGSARDLLNRAETVKSLDSEAGELKAQDQWLFEFLSQGQKPSADCMAEGKAAGFTDKQIRTAREKLRISPVKDGYQGKWMWSLPEGTFTAK